ncbi:MAG: hypothetical protein ACRDHM_05120 [Actinomycetota bacterium]
MSVGVATVTPAMMRPPHLAAQGAGLLSRSLREVADSLAAGFELLGLGLTWFVLHVALGALVITKLVLLAVRGAGPTASGHRRRGGT